MTKQEINDKLTRFVPTYEEFLFEIGDATAKPYDFVYFGGKMSMDNKYSDAKYLFKTESNLQYIAIFHQQMGSIWEFEFGIFKESQLDIKTITNKGEFYKIMSTILNIMKDFIDKYAKDFDVQIIHVQGDRKLKNDKGKLSKRLKAYYTFLNKHKKMFKDISLKGDSIYLTLK